MFGLHLGQSVWLGFASWIAGALNAVAGAGSFLSFPALLNTGVPAIQANATNTVALWPGQITSIAGFREELRGQGKLLAALGICAVLGGTTGAILLLHTQPKTFLNIVPYLLLMAALLFAVSDRLSKWLEKRVPKEKKQSWAGYLVLGAGVAIVCVYIGYFGAGAGFLIMSLLAMYGVQKLERINGIKTVTTSIANAAAVTAFIVERKVVWRECLLMMATAALGGYLAARLSRRLNQNVLRVLVVCIGLGVSAYFFVRKS